MQTYRVPDGYQLDPQSGFYYRETQIPGPDGQMVKHIVWFNAETGAYSQQSYYLPQPTTPTSDPWADARHGGGGYSPEPPPPPPPPKPPIIKKIVIPIVTVIFVVGVGVAGVKLLPPLIGGGNEPASTVQSGESKPAGDGLFGGSDKVEESEIGNTMMNLQNGGLMAYHNGWVYYADATKGGALYARKEGQDAEKAVLIAPGQICNINVLGDELVYTYSGGDGVSRLAISGEAKIYLPHRYGKSIEDGSYCPVSFWPLDENAKRNTAFGHVMQFYAGMAYKITGVKQFEKSGSGLSKPILIGQTEQKYFNLIQTPDGVFAGCGVPGDPYDDMRSYRYVKLTEGEETTAAEMPDGRMIRRSCWMDGKIYIEAQKESFEGVIYCYDPKTQALDEIGAGYSLLAWDGSLFYIGSDRRSIVELKPGEAAGRTVFTREKDIGLLMCETDGRFAALSGSWGKEFIFERQGDGLSLVSETESGEDESAQYLTSCAIFELGDKTHKYFDRYNGGINPY